MFFYQNTPVEKILEMIKNNIVAMIPNAKWGIDINIIPHKRQRTLQQNKLLWEIYNHIVEFYNDTGFIIDNLNIRFLNSDFLHEYFKVRFNVKSTAKLNTQDFSRYVDSIQNEMIEQSCGEYEPIICEENYIEKTNLI